MGADNKPDAGNHVWLLTDVAASRRPSTPGWRRRSSPTTSHPVASGDGLDQGRRGLVRVRELGLRVAETAGTAATAVAVTGAYIVVAGAGALEPTAN
jgi:hypothetical protein